MSARVLEYYILINWYNLLNNRKSKEDLLEQLHYLTGRINKLNSH